MPSSPQGAQSICLTDAFATIAQLVAVGVSLGECFFANFLQPWAQPLQEACHQESPPVPRVGAVEPLELFEVDLGSLKGDDQHSLGSRSRARHDFRRDQC